MSDNGKGVPRALDLAGAIHAFERLARHAFACHAQSTTALLLAVNAELLREIQGGRIVSEDEWLETLKAAASAMYGKGAYEYFRAIAN